jgi:hypothetical protein
MTKETPVNTTMMTRLLAAVSARRALLGGSLAALALTVLPGDQQEAAVGKPARRRRNQRQRGRNRGGNRPRATPCTVCDDLDDCPFTTIQAAINAASAGATIVICEGTYEEDITISRNLTLAAQGRGPKNFELEGTGASTVVTVPAGVTATIQGLAISGGSGTLDQQGFRSGGGIYNSGTLTLATVVVENNQVNQGLLGGGIYNDDGAELTVTAGSVISNNEADQGAGIYNDGTVTVGDGSEVAENTANGNGGGIFINQGQVTLDEADVLNNTAAGDGGGIFNDTGSLTIQNNSFVADNEATNSGGFGGDGGGIANVGGTVTVDQSRVSSNEADERGGGIFNFGTLVLQNASVVTDNDADDTGGGIFSTGGSISLSGASRVVDNKPNDCVGTTACTA